MINVPVSVGELIDKITILEIKLREIKDEGKRKNCHYEHELLVKIMNDHKISFPTQMAAIKAVNEKLWKIEDDLRLAEVSKKFDEHFIAATREEYRANDLRAKIKRDINELAHSEIVEEKDYVTY